MYLCTRSLQNMSNTSFSVSDKIIFTNSKGQGFEQLDVVKDVPAHGKGVGLSDL